jgi:hypothetical protein
MTMIFTRAARIAAENLHTFTLHGVSRQHVSPLQPQLTQQAPPASVRTALPLRSAYVAFTGLPALPSTAVYYLWVS